MNIKKKIFTFVILHYYAIEDTKKCVESIKKNCENENYKIVIVDNGSSDGSGIELRKIYKGDKNIFVLLNEKNLGFSKGNNVGFKYAKEKLKSDFIILCNNDTLLLQKCFCRKIYNEFLESKFAVLGPKIILPNDKINMLYKEIPSLKKLRIQLYDLILNYISNLFYLNIVYKLILKIIKNIYKKMIRMNNFNDKNSKNFNLYQKNIILHGCFLIFSKEYIMLFDGLDDRTFLYREEEFLALRLRTYNLKSIYNPNIKIFHSEDASTNQVNKKNRKKNLFICKNQIRSTILLIKELKKNI